MTKKSSRTLSGFEYYVKGKNPRLLIHSGTHGDEHEVIDLVRACIHKYEQVLPDLLFVPYVSPSAVSLKKRHNSRGFDLNRQFFANTREPEVVENIRLLSQFKFDLFVSFHEDPESTQYYIYDSGHNEVETQIIKDHNFILKKSGISLLNGVDDPNDPHLGFEFKDGYRRFNESVPTTFSGTASEYAMLAHGVKTCLIPEIPGRLNTFQKEFIVESFFVNVLCKASIYQWVELNKPAN
jgi:hypothetical protein